MGDIVKDDTYSMCLPVNKVWKVLSSYTGGKDKTHTFIDKRRHWTQSSEYTFIVTTHLHMGCVHHIVELAF